MILGIDPGLTGGLAIYAPDTQRILCAASIPTLTLQRNKKFKRFLDIHQLVALIRNFAGQYSGLRATIELVGAMPGQGVSSVFSFGFVTGGIETAVAAAGIPYDKVTPAVWKKALACPADKDGALLRASQLMPASAAEWAPLRGQRNKEECIGIAEAALLAYYGAKILS